MGGWILAELTMVLVIVVLGSQAALPASAPEPGATPSPAPSGSGGAPTHGLDGPDETKPGIDTDFRTCEVRMRSVKDQRAARRLHRCIVKKGEGRRAGLTLLFGVSWEPSRPTAGEEVSNPMAHLLEPLFGKDAPVMRAFMRSYLKHPTTGLVIAETYYFQE